MKVVVAGAGRMGGIRGEDLAADPRVDHLVIANRNPDRARELASRIKAEVVAWEDILTTAADAYVMALATDAHHGLLEGMLRTGLPVLCEKPIALTLSKTTELCDLAASTGATLHVGFQRRFDPGIARIRDLASSGALGTLYDMTLTSRDRTPPDRAYLSGNGGIFRDLHIHDLDLVAWICESPIESIFATRTIRGPGAYAEFNDGDITRIVATTQSGVIASIEGARHDARGHDVRMEVHGSADSVGTGYTSRTPLHVIDEDAVHVDDHPYTGFIDRFRDAFRQSGAEVQHS